MDKYTVQIEDFQGPLDVLLQLIESQELEITKVSLAKVADQYIYFINNHPEIPPDDIADFLVIASKLILIKSKALLPTLDIEDEDFIDLEKQLKMYKQFLEASKKIEATVAKGNFNYAKEKLPPNAVEGFQPPKRPITPDRLRDVFELVLSRLEPVVILPKKVIERVMTIKEKIAGIRDQIFKQACISFKNMVCETGSKGEKIVGFLAVLELVKQKIITVEQQDFLGDITIYKSADADHRQVSTETEFI